MSQDNTDNKNKSTSVDKIEASDQLTQAEFLKYLKQSEKNNEEILKSLKFIKRYYFWRSIMKSLKIGLLILIIILGILGWGTIIETFTNLVLAFQEDLGEILRSGLLEKVNIN